MRLKTEVMNVLPKKSSDAITVNEITSKLGVSKQTVRTCIKELRSEGNKILWNNRGSYISNDINEINNHIEICNKMKTGYHVGMNNLIRSLRCEQCK